MRGVEPWQAVLVVLAVLTLLLLVVVSVIGLRLGARALEIAGKSPQPEDRVEAPAISPRADVSGTLFGEPSGEDFAEIPSLGVMDVIGYLKYAPGADGIVCSGPIPTEGVLTLWRCSSSGSGAGPVYEVRVLGDGPLSISSVEATVRGATREQASAFLGYVAGLCFEEPEALNSATWVEANIATGGQLFAAGADLTLYGTQKLKTLVVAGTAAPGEEGDSLDELDEIDPVEDFDFPDEPDPATVPEDSVLEGIDEDN
jgi:hypothetical protein